LEDFFLITKQNALTKKLANIKINCQHCLENCQHGTPKTAIVKGSLAMRRFHLKRPFTSFVGFFSQTSQREKARKKGNFGTKQQFWPKKVSPSTGKRLGICPRAFGGKSENFISFVQVGQIVKI
jgi:hypothetical protein